VVIGYVILNSLVATPQLEGMLSISYSSIFILRVIFIALILGIFSGIYPALRAVRIEPIEILRYE
jgi:ABC-type antimicrobial peptide transport system permease subunit